MQAQDIMTPDPSCCLPSDTVRRAAEIMTEEGCGLLPVVESMDSKKLIGVITDRDITCRVVAKGMDCVNSSVQNVMTSGKLWTVSPMDDVDRVIDQMEEGQVRRIPVVNEMGQVQGIISTADIAMELDDEVEIAEVFEVISEPENIPRA